MTANCQQGPTGTPGHVTTVKLLAACLMTLGCVSFGLGIPTVVFGAMAPKAHTPYIAGLGIASGAFTVAAGAVILVYLRKLETGAVSKKLAVAYGVLSQLSLQTTNVHTAFSLWGLITCATEMEVGKQCGGANRPALYLLTGINLTIGLAILCSIITVMCLFRKATRYVGSQQEKNGIPM